MTSQIPATDQRFDKVDAQLSGIDTRFDNVDARLNMQFANIDAQFDRISSALVKGFDKIDKQLETKANASDMNRAINLLDSLIKRQETADQKRLVMGYQLTNLNNWTELAAKRVKILFVR
jgi:hypothetical protein